MAGLGSSPKPRFAGGRGASVNASAEIYDPKFKRFSETGSLHTARYKHTAGLLQDGKVLIAGGSDERDWHGTMATAEVYDPQSGRFSKVASLNDRRYKLPPEAVRLASGEILIAGGSKQVELYDPATMKFQVASGTLSDDWHFMTETRLQDGTVLLAGGYADDDRGTAQTWLFNSARH